MSSNIRVQKICQHCGEEFTAQKTTTKFCGLNCARREHKKKLRTSKIEAVENETRRIKNQPIEHLKAKEFLSVREVAKLLGCSVRSTYHYINVGKLNAANLGQRITRVKRSDIDRLFEQTKATTEQPTNPAKLDLSECYTISEAVSKYNISDRALNRLIERNGIPKIKRGWFAYVPKADIDRLLTKQHHSHAQGN